MSGDPFLLVHDTEGNDLVVSVAAIVSVTAAMDGASEINLGSHTVRVDETCDEIARTLGHICGAPKPKGAEVQS